jgi:hypothetical protein
MAFELAGERRTAGDVSAPDVAIAPGPRLAVAVGLRRDGRRRWRGVRLLLRCTTLRVWTSRLSSFT